MKALKWIIIVLLLIVTVLVLIGLVLLKEMNISTSTHIKLTPDKVFHSVATFCDRQAWDPWLELDESATCEISSNPDYIGSSYKWSGERLGSGKMVVDTVAFGKLVRSSIWFREEGKPSEVIWTFKDEEGETHVTWSIKDISSNPLHKLMFFFNKGAVQESLEKGLSNLKTHLETNGVKMSILSGIESKDYSPINAVIAEGMTTIEEISTTMGLLFQAVMQQVAITGAQPAGAPFAKYYDYDENAGTTHVMAGIPVSEGPGHSDAIVSIEGFSALKGTHTGPYTEFILSYDLLTAYMLENSIEPSGEVWEFYYTDPETEPNQHKWVTDIAFVVKK